MVKYMYDVAILGAGPVGSSLALMLARVSPNPSRILLVQNKAASECQSYSRILAVNYGSRITLSSLQAWPDETTDIFCVHVSQRGRFGRVVIDHKDLAVPQLGSTVSYQKILGKLHKQVQKSGVTITVGTEAKIVNQSSNSITVSQGENYFDCSLAVQSYGTNQGECTEVSEEYSAVLTTVQTGVPCHGWAWERFTKEGSIAFLPHPEISKTYAVIWCCSRAKANYLKTLNDKKFSDILNSVIGSRIGRLSVCAERKAFPLLQSYCKELYNSRLVKVGNAAQSLHPVSGQGFNLGLRDAACLTQSLSKWLLDIRDHPSHVLKEFARSRNSDRFLTAKLTNAMSRIFVTGYTGIEHTCGLTLLALDLIKPLRSLLARHLMQGRRI